MTTDLTPYLEALSPEEQARFLARVDNPAFAKSTKAMNAQALDNWRRYAETARTERQRAKARRVVALLEAQA